MVDKIAWPHVRLGNLITLKNGDYLPVELTCVDGTVPVYGGGDIKGYTSNSNCEPDTVIISRQGATCGTVRQVSSPFWATEHAMIVGIKYDGLLPRWGFYAMSNLNLGRLSMAAAQPGISQEKVKSQRIYLPPVDEQRRIADFLDEKCAQIDRAITSAEQSIQEYKAYRVSVVSDTVDDGRFPKVRFKNVASVASSLVSPEDYPELIEIDPDNIEKDTGRLVKLRTVYEVGAISAKHYFHQGQILYSKIRPMLNKVAIAPCNGLCSADMYPIETSQNAEWLRYAMTSNAFVQQVGLACARVKMPKINVAQLGSIAMRLPPLDEQRRIAGFLDEKCAQIDRAVEAKQAIIDELKSYKKSLIYEVVTGKREV